MKTAAKTHYLQNPVGAQLLPHLAQRAELRRRISVFNLPRLRDLFGKAGRASSSQTAVPGSGPLPDLG